MAGTVTEFYMIDGSTAESAYGEYINWLNDDPFEKAYGFWSSDMTGKATHPYFLWYDSPGVYRIKGDGIMAYYNPTFEKYVPGAVNFERVVQQWDTDVAEYGVEVGGTGVLRKLRLLGSSIILPSMPTVDPEVVGELYLDAGVVKQSAGP